MRILWATNEPPGGPIPNREETLPKAAKQDENPPKGIVANYPPGDVDKQEKSPEKGQKSFG